MLGSELACIAVKESSHAVYLTDTDGKKVWRVDPSGTQSAISLPEEPEGIAVNTKKGFVYVASASSGKLFVIDQNDRLTGTFDVAPGISRVVANPRTGIVYMASNEEGAVYSLNPNVAGAAPQATEVRTPLALALDDEEGILYAASTPLQGGGPSGLVAVSISSGRVVGRVEIAGEPWFIAVDGATHRVLVGNLQSSDVAIVSVSRQ